nr:Shedu immune nuclease family protein [uncultured Rhodopila sp.]
MAVEPSDDHVLLFVNKVETGLATIELQMGRYTSQIADRTLSDTAPLPRKRLFDVDARQDRIRIYPTITWPREDFLKARYKRIREICVEGLGIQKVPEDDLEAKSYLVEYLPMGFIQDPAFGLGLIKELRPVINSIEEVDYLDTIVISSRHDTQIEANIFYFSFNDYEKVRLAMQRITKLHQAEGLRDRNIFANNELLHKIDPIRFPEKHRPYRPGTVFKLLGGANGNSKALAENDRKTITSVFELNAAAVARNEPTKFIQLQKNIEIISLDMLLTAFSKKMERDRPESEWQKLLETNPFILSMLFGYPIVVVQSSASVGGTTLQGNGNKIADFLVKNECTHNAAIVEIKKPQTDLLGSEYRSGVWNPSKELTGAIVQILDQRRRFTSNISQLKHASHLNDLEADAVDCVVVAGRTPETADQRSSFELVRNQLKDVRIITFDELLAKLVLLRELLSTGPSSAESGKAKRATGDDAYCNKPIKIRDGNDDIPF